jgi:DNA-binding CsgD family transcriptional regulator
MRSTLARIEAKLDILTSGTRTSSPSPAEGNADLILLSSFTPKQHAILQMLMRDASSEEIAERMKVSINTIKTHLTILGRKIGTKRRASLISTLAPVFARCPEAAYIGASSGLPKYWDRDYRPDDPLNQLVVNQREEDHVA